MTRTNRSRRLYPASLCLIAVVLATAVALLAAHGARAQNISSAQMSSFATRLNLTAEQKTAMAPVMQQSTQAREAIFRKHGVDLKTGKKPGLFGLMALGSEMKKVTAWTRGRLAKILNPVQIQEYDRIVAEQTEVVKRILLR